VLYGELKKIKISIAGRFASKTTEYIWFRNLSKSAHIDRFGYVENRSVGGHIEHIGGQSPISIDVLNDVRLAIHLAHDNKDFLEFIRSSLENPVRRLEILHLGRAEDWIVIEELSEVEELSKFPVKRVDRNFQHFFWIPEKIFMNDAGGTEKSPFKRSEGLLYNVPTFWTVVDFDRTLNRHGQRIFEYMRAKLNDGLVREGKFHYDDSIGLPIFLANFEVSYERDMGQEQRKSQQHSSTTV
ncbi:MAG: hypothetical protein QW376_08875, partial [Candidatus Caldarchaeum sp.]